MNRFQRRRCTNKNCKRLRRGATAAFFAAMLPVALAIACYAINIVYMELARTELQITMDVATRAAGRTLAMTGDTAASRQSAERLMQLNPFANQKMSLQGSDLVFGVSTRFADTERYQFTPGGNPNAVKIEANGRVVVPTLFPTLGAPVRFRPIKTAISTQTELDIALVLDRSGSMAFRADEPAGYVPSNAPFGWVYGMPVPPEARWLDAVDAVNSFLKLMEESFQEERVSLSTYSELPFLDSPLSNRYDSVRYAMQFRSMIYLGGATNIGDGIQTGHLSLSDSFRARPWATRVMILLTDGIHNIGTDPLETAARAAKENITIYTITFSNEADQARMREVAKIGAGKHLHATSGQELVQAFEEIARTLPTLITY